MNLSHSISTTALSLRPIERGDEPFLFKLYAGTRADEMAMVDWDEPTKLAFLRQQFAAQQTHYQSYFPAGSHQIVIVDAQPAGRIYVDRDEDRIHLLDIALLPERRGQGLGGTLMDDLIAEARHAGLPITLHVYRLDERVLGWYQRLGFSTIGESGMYYLMELA